MTPEGYVKEGQNHKSCPIRAIALSPKAKLTLDLPIFYRISRTRTCTAVLQHLFQRTPAFCHLLPDPVSSTCTSWLSTGWARCLVGARKEIPAILNSIRGRTAILAALPFKLL